MTGVGCHSLFQGIFPTWGLNPGFLHCRQILYHLNHQGSPFVTRIAKKSQLDCSLEPKTPVKQEDPGACSVPLFQGWASSADTRRSSTAVSRKHASLWAAQQHLSPSEASSSQKKKKKRRETYFFSHMPGGSGLNVTGALGVWLLGRICLSLDNNRA